ncbi:unnamed protein product [Mesocestoides corti]|uniref:Nuclear pore complex protein Nup88 n=1 Tax=Mesocestoides corti TaxID=53468 RepID=A0A0R3U145_MESCO|nr:unnamed protein product [Mesocestoides corti]
MEPLISNVLSDLDMKSQEKIIAKLATAYDSLSGECASVSPLVSARWHPKIHNILVLLTKDGKLIFCRCKFAPGGAPEFETELIVHVLEPPENDAGENCSTVQGKLSQNLNLSVAMGAVCSDFDFGSSLFHGGVRVSHDVPLDVPIYVLCENGDIILVSVSQASINQPLVRFVRILPANEDYYSFDFLKLICLRSEKEQYQPDVICFANRVGRIFHGVCLHVPTNVLLQSNSRPQGRSVPVLLIVDSVDLELPALGKSLNTSVNLNDKRNDEYGLDFSGLDIALVPSTYIWSDPDDYQPCSIMNSYFCLHNFGIHHVRVSWLDQFRGACSSIASSDYSNANLLQALRTNTCSTEYLLLSRSLHPQAYDGVVKERVVIGLLPHRAPPSSNETATVDPNSPHAVIVIFSSKPELVTVPIPSQLSTLRQCNSDICCPSSGQGDFNCDGKCDSRLLPRPPLCPPKDSDFVATCSRSLLVTRSSWLPIMSSHDEETVITEADFFRFFLNATDVLRTSQLSRLAGLSSSVCEFADYVEGQLAAQSEEVAFLAAERDMLHTRAAELTDRHSRVLERHETLNHRLSELARRIYSIDSGLTDAEVEMGNQVRNLRDRLKSGLLVWLENIRLQYEQLAIRLGEHRRASAIRQFEGRLGIESQPTLSPTQVEHLAKVLKSEGSEIDCLVKAVGRLNLISAASFVK